jgi:membrane fusion protein (multidrug efflux system)
MGDWVDRDWVVENGLSGGETIIVGGLNRIRPGIPVKTVAYKDSSASSKPTASSN